MDTLVHRDNQEKASYFHVFFGYVLDGSVY